jgi:hypothetical protein
MVERDFNLPFKSFNGIVHGKKEEKRYFKETCQGA